MPKNIHSKQYVIAGAPDFELNINTKRNLIYDIVYPTEKAKGILLFIQGHGLDPAYIPKLLQYIATEYGYAAVCATHHCCRSRLNNGASLTLPQPSIQAIQTICASNNIKYNTSDLNSIIFAIANKNIPLHVDGNLIPPDNEYQNFGVIQALDNLYVIQHLSKNNLNADFNNIVLLGTSHGGFIAHMMNKLAPNTFNHIIDNSSYVTPPPNFLGLSHDFIITENTVKIMCKTKSMWNHSDRLDRHYYGISQREIRDTANNEHLATISPITERKVNIHAFNSSTDSMSPVEDKEFQKQAYEKEDHAYYLKIITEKDIDGRVFKDLEHGMNASMQGLCDLILPSITARPNALDYKRKTNFTLNCNASNYNIRHDDTKYPVRINLNTRRKYY